jgi:hypothetical protein
MREPGLEFEDVGIVLGWHGEQGTQVSRVCRVSLCVMNLAYGRSTLDPFSHFMEELVVHDETI